MLTLLYDCTICPCIVLQFGHIGVICSYIVLLCVHTHMFFVTAVVIIMPSTIDLSHICAMAHVHVYVWILEIPE